MFRVDVSFLKENPGETIHLELAGPLKPIGEGAEKIAFPEPVRVELELTGTETAILAKGAVHAAVRLNCARCLEPFNLPLHVPFEEVYYFAGKGEEDWVFFEGPAIDLEPEITRAILLEIPMKAVCREDCRGFCPDCGRNLNLEDCRCREKKIDPRLAVLGDFFK
ncbi:MAG: DUF177 domain-containing protein [Armatimonadetes bacterium]|nr:DUF177 domain-containing protein [Armatimonadota bacterium]